MNYSQLMQKLFSINLFSGIKMGLENCHQLDRALNYPHQQFKTIHIAGTNGKGSTSTKIAASLQNAGYRVGLYTSPHISCFRERISINGKMISEKAVEALLPQLFDLIESNKIPATFFEIATYLAFLYFAHERVDVVVLETGLGGRLDATNVVTPILSVITSIGLEHTDILGNTIEEITLEKAGIIKKEVPVVIGPHVQKDIIEQITNSLQCTLKQVQGHYLYFDDENRAIARLALEEITKKISIPDDDIEKGLQVLPPCRMQLVHNNKLPIILDVAHNPNGLEHLFQALRQMFPGKKFRVVLGLSSTKDIPGCLKILKREATAFHPVSSSNGRNIPVAELANELRKAGIDDTCIVISDSIHESIQEAIKRAVQDHEVIVCCGTFFIMGAIRESLGFKDPKDDFDTNERMISKV